MSDSLTSMPPAKKRKWLPFLVLLLILAPLFWWLWPGKNSAPPSAGDAIFRSMALQNVPVRLSTAVTSDFPVYFNALGTVTSLNTVNVRSRVGGEIVRINFTEGQNVQKGDVLVEIDPRPYQAALLQAEGVLQQNQARLKNAQVDLARYEQLHAEDSVARQTLETQRALVEEYRGTLHNSQGAVDEAKLNLEFTKIHAPVSGRLGLRQIDIGNLLSANDATVVTVITQTRPIHVSFTLSETDLPVVLQRVRAGDMLTVEVWDRGNRQQLATGKLDSIDNQIDTTTGTLKFKAIFDNTDELLFPNQFVNVRLHAQTLSQVVMIPSAALQVGNQGTFVFVVNEDNKAHLRLVTAGPSDREWTVITSGLQTGEKVVLEGVDRLKEGTAVEVVATDTAEDSQNKTTHSEQ